MYRIVCVEPGYLAKVEEGYLYEVPEDYIIRNRKFPGIASLQNCDTLENVRELLSDAGMENLTLFGETLGQLLIQIDFLSREDNYPECNPEIQIFQTKESFKAIVYLDKETE